jgi:hypothetical protein
VVQYSCWRCTNTTADRQRQRQQSIVQSCCCNLAIYTLYILVLVYKVSNHPLHSHRGVFLHRGRQYTILIASIALLVNMPGYYDIDDFLAEEEVVQCKTLFDFSYLSYLDPDTFTNSKQQQQQQHVLPENSKIKIPVWAIRKWADLGFCRIILPVQYRSRARELIQADPASVTLRPRFYRSGHTLVSVIETSSRKNAQILYTQPSSIERNVQLQQLDANLQEARQLRETLLQVSSILLLMLVLMMMWTRLFESLK